MKRADPTFNLSIIESTKMMRFDPLRNFDPKKLTLSLDLFRAGRLRDLALVIDAQEERDDTLAGVVPKTKASVARHGYEICINERVPAGLEKDAERQKEALEHFYNQLRVTNALDQDEVGGVSLLLRQMMDAKSKRYAVHNIVWHPGALPSATLWFTPLWFFENSTGKMRFISTPYGYDGQEMAPGEWLVTKGQGIGIACSVAWCFKHLSLRDWVLYNGRCGLPGFEGITDAAPGSEQWQNMVNAVARAASEFRWVRNRTEEIKTIEFGTTGTLPFPPLVERMDRAMATLWRGGDLGTMSKDGAAVGSNPQESETALIEQDDAQWLSETIQLKLDRLVLDNVFGEDAPTLAYFRILGAQTQNTEQDIKVDTFLVGAGFPISRKQAAERYARPLPEANDELLTAPATPAPSGFGALPIGQTAANEAAAAGREALFVATSTNRLAPEIKAAIEPILRRLAEIDAIPDATQQRAALANLRAALPELYRQAIAQVPAAAAVLEQIIGTAFASGVAEAAQARKGTP